MRYKDLQTITGVPLREVSKRLDERLPDNAYKAIGGGPMGKAGLTDINGAYLMEVAEEVFGILGVGWVYEVSNLSYDPANGRGFTMVEVTVKYQFTDGNEWWWSAPITHPGYDVNGEHSIKGAVTNGLGSCFSRMCWQSSVYKGVRGHDPNWNRVSDILFGEESDEEKAKKLSAAPPEIIQQAMGRLFEINMQYSPQYILLGTILQRQQSGEQVASTQGGLRPETLDVIGRMASSLPQKYAPNGSPSPVICAQHIWKHVVPQLNQPPFDDNSAAQWIDVAMGNHAEAIAMSVAVEMDCIDNVRFAANEGLDVLPILSKYSGIKHRTLDAALKEIKPEKSMEIMEAIERAMTGLAADVASMEIPMGDNPFETVPFMGGSGVPN